MIDQKTKTYNRVIGFDSHPDTFTAAILTGQTPAQAQTEKVFNKVPMSRLETWAKKTLTAEDLVVLEASGNSFHVARALRAVERQALVLESCQLGKLKEAHANNDKLSAVRIAKAYLAGTAKSVWIPDAKTQERRDCFHAHNKACKRTTQIRNRLRSYLSDHGVRLSKGTALAQPNNKAVEEKLRQAKPWTPCQWQILEGLLLELRQAEEQRRHWRGLIAQEVLNDPELLSLVRLCGVREMVAFALGALIGDIKRFKGPGSLVKYIGLNPAFDNSGEGQWSGGIGGHGRKDLRSLLIEAAQSILRSNDPLAHWGKKLLARKGSVKLAVAAVARKLTVAVWYLLMGQWTPLQEIDERLVLKVGKVISRLGTARLKKTGQPRDALRQQAYHSLKTGRVYKLNPKKTFFQKPKGNCLAEEYGLR